MRELTSLYMQRGLEPELARQVAEQLMVKDALDAHAREELGLTDINSAQPYRQLSFSALSFSAGAVLPLIVAWLSPLKLAFLLIILSTLFSLAVLGYISSVLSKASCQGDHKNYVLEYHGYAFVYGDWSFCRAGPALML